MSSQPPTPIPILLHNHVSDFLREFPGDISIAKSKSRLFLSTLGLMLVAFLPESPSNCLCRHHLNNINHLPPNSICSVYCAYCAPQCQHSCQLRPFILLPEHVLDLLGELPGDLILRLVHLPVHHLVTLVNHLAALVRHLANLVDQRTQQNGNHI